MKKLTSGSTYLQKRVFPVIFGCVAGLMALPISNQASAIPLVLAILIGLITGFLATKFAMHLTSQYVDEVYDAGDCLVIRKRGIEESIDLRDIQEVCSSIMSPAGVWLHLRRDSSFGWSIKFLPGSSLFAFSKLAKSLNNRIKEAESGLGDKIAPVTPPSRLSRPGMRV